MTVKIGEIQIEDREIDHVTNRGAGMLGFEFKGHSIDERGKELVESLQKLQEKGEYVECEATSISKDFWDKGKLEDFKYEVSKSTPGRYSFQGTVVFAE